MREKELEQVLEEALSACIEDGRSIEDVLAEYAAYRGTLEPLLVTALDTYDALQGENPPTAVDERLERFLQNARARDDVRYLRGERKEYPKH